MIAQSPFFGRRRTPSRRVFPVAAPIAIILAAMPFADAAGPSSQLAIALGKGAALAAVALVVLFLLLAIARPVGWSPRRATQTAETVTLWLAACAVVSCVF